MKKLLLILCLIIFSQCEIKLKTNESLAETKTLYHNGLIDINTFDTEQDGIVYRIFVYDNKGYMQVVNVTKEKLEIEKLKLEIENLKLK